MLTTHHNTLLETIGLDGEIRTSDLGAPNTLLYQTELHRDCYNTIAPACTFL